MKKNLLIIIAWILNTNCLYSQMLPKFEEVELLKGKIRKIEIQNYDPETKRTSRNVSEYDSSGRIISKINYYIKKNPHREFFSYDSIGNIIMRIYESNDYSHQYIYEYEYDNKERIIMQLEQRDGNFFRSYDSIVYNNNLPIQYIEKHPYSSDQIFIHYTIGSNGEKIRRIEEKDDSGTTRTSEELRLYNDNGFLTKRTRKVITHYPEKPNASMDEKIQRAMMLDSGRHFEEYDFVDYKYDKQGNWIERKVYLDWKQNGRNFHLKEKRKIKYY